jgi:hypothetical protein
MRVSKIRLLPARAEGKAPKFILLRDGQVRTGLFLGSLIPMCDSLKPEKEVSF